MSSENEKNTSNDDLPSSQRKTIPSDQPPPYDTIAATVTLLASINDPDDDQQAIRLPNSPVPQPNAQNQHQTYPTAAPPLPRVAPPARPHKRSASTSSVSSVNSLKAKKSWFSFTSSSNSSTPGPAPALPPIPGSAHPTSSKVHTGSTAPSARTQAEVRTTVSLLISDLVRDSNKAYDQGSNTAALGVLASCAEVCRVHAVPFAEMLQDKSVEGHSPVYWAIVKRPRRIAVEGSLTEADAESDTDGEKDLITAMLSHIPASSLHSEAAHELRLACLAASDQDMYRRLLPFLQSGSSLSSSMDAMILGSRGGDDVTVSHERGASADGKFFAKIKLVGYHTRMMVKREIDLEFIARNRIWRFTLLITADDAAAWRGPLPGTWCVALSLQEPSPPTWVDAELFLVDRAVKDEEDKVVGGSALPLKSKQMLECPRNGGAANQILVPLDKVPFAGLQYSGAVVDDTLRLLLEVRLRRPDPESM